MRVSKQACELPSTVDGWKSFLNAPRLRFAAQKPCGAQDACPIAWTDRHQYRHAPGSFLPSATAFALAFTALSLFLSEACNPGRTWWRNPSLLTDLCYLVVVPLIAPYLGMSLMVAGAGLLSGVMTVQDIAGYFEHGRGPLAGLPFWGQVVV
jgi:hypothetical protein